MTELRGLIRRNSALFFRDKGMFITSLLTPLILLFLYATFLANLYHDMFVEFVNVGVPISDRLIDGAVGSQLLSSLLAVSCVTVSFCSNMLMVQDRAQGQIKDLTMSPVRPSSLALGYYLSTALTTLIVCCVATTAGLIYIAFVGWYLSFVDVCLIFLDVFLLVMFGTALSSVVHFFLTSQGQISAVGTIISAGYGFVCGAYMPISQFSSGLQNAVMLLPGTYGTALVRNHAFRGVLKKMESDGIPSEALDEMRNMLDCDIKFFGHAVSEPMMYLVLVGFILLLGGVYLLMNVLREKRRCRERLAAAKRSEEIA